jgi:hypothetical protein
MGPYERRALHGALLSPVSTTVFRKASVQVTIVKNDSMVKNWIGSTSVGLPDLLVPFRCAAHQGVFYYYMIKINTQSGHAKQT